MWDFHTAAKASSMSGLLYISLISSLVQLVRGLLARRASLKVEWDGGVVVVRGISETVPKLLVEMERGLSSSARRLILNIWVRILDLEEEESRFESLLPSRKLLAFLPLSRRIPRAV